jgi:hypothetical protein
MAADVTLKQEAETCGETLFTKDVISAVLVGSNLT